MKAWSGSSWARKVAVAGAFLALCGCADLERAVSLPPVNPESPVAAQAAAAAAGQYPTPNLHDVPPAPKDVPAPAAVKANVIALVRCRRGFERWTERHPPMASGSEAFAEAMREQAQVNPAVVPPAGQAAMSEAEAAALRAYAAPPPPIGETSAAASQTAASDLRQYATPPTGALAAASPSPRTGLLGAPRPSPPASSASPAAVSAVPAPAAAPAQVAQVPAASGPPPLQPGAPAVSLNDAVLVRCR